MTALITEGLFRVDGERAVLFGSRRRSTGWAWRSASTRRVKSSIGWSTCAQSIQEISLSWQ